MAERNYEKIGRAYMRAVLRKETPACRWVQLLCERQRADLARERLSSWPYRWDVAAAGRVCGFVESFHHYKGEAAGTAFLLSDWQVFITSVIFGWQQKDPPHYRRFRQVYLELPRKNGKTTWTAAIGLFMLCGDGEAGSEVYTGATTRDQARICYTDAKVLAQRNPAFLHAFGVRAEERRIYVPETHSHFSSISKDLQSNEGLNCHLAIIDELHAHKRRGVFETLSLSQGARSEPLLWMITTAGTDLAGVCYEQHTYTQSVLQHMVADESHFGAIYTVDEKDHGNWDDPAVWAMANPNLGVSLNPADLQSLSIKARQSRTALGSFKTKRLNIWTASGAQWMDIGKWQACASDTPAEAYKGCPAWLALDLASHVDLTSLCLLFRPTADEYACFFRFFLPEDRVKSQPHFVQWAEDGYLQPTDGDFIDFDVVRSEIVSLAQEFDVLELPYDQFKSLQLASSLERDFGLRMALVRQGVLAFSPAMKALEGLVFEKKIKHDGSPCMTWQMSNVRARVDSKDNVYPIKERMEAKIDGPVSLLMALGRAMIYQVPQQSKYETQGLATT